ncbi:MAG: hypothetical protein BRC40_02750 [Cyanobacteria bacterium QH_8_48_120]|nr:MAG: hypothetical protein BRC40_02750 [Cyanobacteria bacterium QH_8_48_120]
MSNSQIKPSILIITGMHRSGTSLTASLLQSAGLDIGQRLIEPGHGNVRGFFENRDFLEFHEMVLRSQGLHDGGWTLQENIKVEQQYVEKAKELISKNASSPMWGWKEPRTTLFLDFWSKFLPDANFLLIYRSPWEVVDSLYRRGDKTFINQPDLAVKIWMRYNQNILDFYNKFTERCLLVSAYSVVNRTQDLIEAIKAKFKMNLAAPAPKIYEPSLFCDQVSDTERATLIRFYFPEVLTTYQKLNQREDLFSEADKVSWFEKLPTFPDKSTAFQDWLNTRHLELQLKSLRSELEQARYQLKQTQAELAAQSNNANTDRESE